MKQLLSVVANANANTFSFLFTNTDCKGDHVFQIEFIFLEVEWNHWNIKNFLA